MNKVLITGGFGTVGCYVSNTFLRKNYLCMITGRDSLDITNRKQVIEKIYAFKPDLIIHLAALTNVDYCEKDPKKALKTNYSGTKNIADACKRINATLLFLSTSAVFNGSKKGYYENDVPSPINSYGRTKLLAENYIKKILKSYYIIRTGWIIGGGKKEKKFISYIINDINNNKDISIVNNTYGTLAYALDCADFIENLTSNEADFGIYHFGSKGICSRLDIATQIMKILKKKAKITPLSSESFNSTFFAPRPQYEVLKSTKIIFSNSWKKSLRRYIQNEFI